MSDIESSTADNLLFSWNCRDELDGHISCVKLFLEDHVKHGTTYKPGSGTSDDHCAPTRELYIACMKQRKKNPVSAQQASSIMYGTGGPKPCEMELSMHGDCVARQLDRTQRLGMKYWTQGGEDKCGATRSNYEKCVRLHEKGATDHWGGGSSDNSMSGVLGKNMAHLIS